MLTQVPAAELRKKKLKNDCTVHRQPEWMLTQVTLAMNCEKESWWSRKLNANNTNFGSGHRNNVKKCLPRSTVSKHALTQVTVAEPCERECWPRSRKLSFVRKNADPGHGSLTVKRILNNWIILPTPPPPPLPISSPSPPHIAHPPLHPIPSLPPIGHFAVYTPFLTPPSSNPTRNINEGVSGGGKEGGGGLWGRGCAPAGLVSSSPPTHGGGGGDFSSTTHNLMGEMWGGEGA